LSSMPVRNPVRDMSGRWSLSLGLHTSHGIPPRSYRRRPAC
jgi:hypothetical protein